MSLDGLRAWVAEVERKLAKRTRVLLALVGIAIAIAAASVFLAIDVRSDSVNEGDVGELQEQLEQRIDEIEAEVEPSAGIGLAPEAGGESGEEPGEGGDSSGDGDSGDVDSDSGDAGDADSGGSSGDADSGEGGAIDGDPGKGGSGAGDGDNLQDLLEQAGAAGN